MVVANICPHFSAVSVSVRLARHSATSKWCRKARIVHRFPRPVRGSVRASAIPKNVRSACRWASAQNWQTFPSGQLISQCSGRSCPRFRAQSRIMPSRCRFGPGKQAQSGLVRGHVFHAVVAERASLPLQHHRTAIKSRVRQAEPPVVPGMRSSQ